MIPPSRNAGRPRGRLAVASVEVDTGFTVGVAPPDGVFPCQLANSLDTPSPSCEYAGMPRLTTDRLHAVVRAIDEFAMVTDFDAYADAAIRAADIAVASDVTTYNEVDIAAGRMTVRTRPADFVYPEGVDDYLATHADEHPLIRYFNETGDGSAFRISDFMSAREFHSSRLYQEIYARIGVEDQMALALPTPRQLVIGLAVNRSRRGFTEADRGALNLLRPYLAQTYRLLQEREAVRRRLSAVRLVLGQNDMAAISLSSPIEELTPGALVLLYRFFGRPGARSDLPGRVESWRARERETPGSGPRSEPAPLLTPLVGHREGHQLVARLLPGTEGPDVVTLRQISALEPSPRQLEDLRLTEREAEVARLLITGAPNASIAAQLRIAAGTVKKHIDHIYRKLGAPNRVTAVKTLLELHLGG